ncbi:phosphatase PAP2 family protein [Arthrobacter sp. Br18]|uniref:phosphatase PAP2 family protein n=1 Tax=Arthrobacter sp. Br18 TaxID=1312954 RepID=UPI0004B74EDB|nr:phosphatase PAP2 family protein [Arthrobacter sp. Br18]
MSAPAPRLPHAARVAAKAVTELFAPAVLLSILLVLVSVHAAGFSRGIGPGLLAVLFVTGVPLGAVILLVRAGRITDHHISDRRQRAPVLGGTLVSIALGILILQLSDAPANLILAVLSSVAGIVTVLVVNLYWKLSAHSAVAVYFAVIVLSLTGLPGLGVLAIPVAVGWSRTTLGAHTPAQVAAGWIVGSGIGVLYTALIA